MYTEQLTNYEKFEVEIEMAIANAKDGDITRGNNWLYKAMDRVEQTMSGCEYKQGRKVYTKVHTQYFV